MSSYAYYTSPSCFDSPPPVCAGHQGTLAEITNAAQNKAVKALGGAPMIALTDDGHEGKWTFPNGTQATYVPFHAGEPNSGTAEQCMIIYFADGGWVRSLDLPYNAVVESACVLAWYKHRAPVFVATA